MTRLRGRRRTVALVVAVVLGVAVATWWLLHRSPAPPASAARSTGPSVPLAAVRAGTLAETLAATGRVGPPAGSDAKLAFPLSGVLASVAVRVGDRVASGEELAALDAGSFRDAANAARAELAAATASAAGGNVGATSVAVARAKLASAQARLALLERGGPAALSDRIAAIGIARQATIKLASDRSTLARAQTLYVGGVAAYKDVQLARAQVATDITDLRTANARVAASDASFAAALDVARADVAQARSDEAAARAQGGNVLAQQQASQAKLAAAQRDVFKSVLRAPSAGIVAAVLKHAGEAVDPTTPAIDLVPPFDREATLAIPVGSTSRIAVGDAVTLALRAPPRTGAGVVRATAPSGEQGSQNSAVVIDGLPRDAIAGEAVSAIITIGHVSGLLVPLEAIVTDPQTGQTVVFVHSDSSDSPFAPKAIRVLSENATSAVVAGDLRAGDHIAAQGAYTLLAPAA